MMNKGGRPRNPTAVSLNYEFILDDGKRSSRCLQCQKILRTTASDRLMKHRNKCSYTNEDAELIKDYVSETVEEEPESMERKFKCETIQITCMRPASPSQISDDYSISPPSSVSKHSKPPVKPTEQRSKGGRPTNPVAIQLHYDLHTISGKRLSRCLQCDKIIKSTATERLIKHRNVCKYVGSAADREMIQDHLKFEKNEPVNPSKERCVNGGKVSEHSNRVASPSHKSDDAVSQSSSDSQQSEPPSKLIKKRDRGGRPKNPIGSKLHGDLITKNRKRIAGCLQCGKIIKSSATERLMTHRNICKYVDMNGDGDVDIPAGIDPLSENIKPEPTLTSSNIKLANVKIWCNELSSARLISPSKISEHDYQLPTINYLHTITDEDVKLSNIKLLKFLILNNIPFHCIDNEYFKDFVTSIRPGYVTKMADSNELATDLLDEVYEDCLQDDKYLLSNRNSVILINDYKTTSISCNPIQRITSLLYTIDCKGAFLKSWDFDLVNDESIDEIIIKSKTIAKDLYNSEPYAVMSTYPISTNQNEMWHLLCNSYIAEYSAKEVMDERLNEQVLDILQAFKLSDLEQVILNSGGAKVVLPSPNNIFSYFDCYTNLLKNLKYMKKICENRTVNLPNQNGKLISDREFKMKIKTASRILTPFYNVFLVTKMSGSSLADVTNEWLNLKLPPEFKDVEDHHKSLWLNKYGLTAYYLHPAYDNNKLKPEHTSLINRFLLENLDAAGCEAWDNFRNNVGLFKTLNEKNFQKPMVYWRTASHLSDSKNLIDLAIKLLTLPASTSQIISRCDEENLRDDITFERLNQLAHIFYSLKRDRST